MTPHISAKVFPTFRLVLLIAFAFASLAFQGGKASSGTQVNCEKVTLSGQPGNVYSVYPAGNHIKVDGYDSTGQQIASAMVDITAGADGKPTATFWQGGGNPVKGGSHADIVAAANACVAQSGSAVVPQTSPPPAPPVQARIPVAAASEPAHSSKPLVTFNATGDEVTVSGGDLRDPVKLKVDYKTPKGGDAIPAGVSAEIDQEHGDRAPVTVTTVIFNGGLDPAPAGARTGGVLKGGVKTLLNRGNTHAEAVVGVCKNPDDCFTEVQATGSTKFTRTVGGFEQGEFVTNTGRDPVAYQEAKTMSDISYALTATKQVIEEANADGQKAPKVALFKAALGTSRFQREDKAIYTILKAAGITAQPQVH